MKLFWIWLAVTVAVLGAYSGVYHAYLQFEPRRVLVVVDTSFPMQSAWPEVTGQLERFSRRRYAQFSLVTEKRRVHGWSPMLELGSVSPYAPRNFANLERHDAYEELEEATEVHFLTNADVQPDGNFDGWTIHELE